MGALWRFAPVFVLAGVLWGCITQSGITLTSGEVEGGDEWGIETFRVDRHMIHMNDYIDRDTPGSLRRLLRENPQITTVVMHDVPGSLDDHASLEAARLVRRFLLDTHLPAEAEIVSGAVDLFLAGVRRTALAGARLGVHSWRNDEGIQGGDLPRDHKDHRLFLEYFQEMGMPEEFYWFTLEAAPFESIHWMTRRELERFRVFTEPMTEHAGH